MNFRMIISIILQLSITIVVHGIAIVGSIVTFMEPVDPFTGFVSAIIWCVAYMNMVGCLVLWNVVKRIRKMNREPKEEEKL